MGGTRSTEGVSRARTDPAPVGVLNPQEVESSLRTLMRQVWSLKTPFFHDFISKVMFMIWLISWFDNAIFSLLIVYRFFFFWKIRISFFAKRVFSDNVLKYENIFLGLTWRDQNQKISLMSLKCGKGQPSPHHVLIYHMSICKFFRYSVQKSKQNFAFVSDQTCSLLRARLLPSHELERVGYSQPHWARVGEGRVRPDLGLEKKVCSTMHLALLTIFRHWHHNSPIYNECQT